MNSELGIEKRCARRIDRVGGLACGLYVEPRATEDIDFLLLPADWERVPDILSPLGWLNLAGPMDFQNIRIRRLTKLSGAEAIVMDFLLADGDFADAVHNPVLFTFRDTSLRVAPPQAIIELKQGRMSDKDRIDIAGLLKVIGEQKS